MSLYRGRGGGIERLDVPGKSRMPRRLGLSFDRVQEGAVKLWNFSSGQQRGTWHLASHIANIFWNGGSECGGVLSLFQFFEL